MATRPTDLADTLTGSATSLGSVGSSVVSPVTAVAFWTAIALPFLHLPLLLLTGLSAPNTTSAFVALLGLNVLALLVGHPHLHD